MPGARCPGHNVVGLEGAGLEKARAGQEFWDFVVPWMRKGEEGDAFEGFIFTWVTFNAWTAQIVNDRSQCEHDAFLVQAAAVDPLLNKWFDLEVSADGPVRDSIMEFSALWPVFKARTLIDMDMEPWEHRGVQSDRAEYRDRCFEGGLDPSDFAPRCWRGHREGPPVDWAHTISAVYQVRCNLFHGGKSFAYSGDQRFVDLARSIMQGVWAQHARREWSGYSA